MQTLRKKNGFTLTEIIITVIIIGILASMAFPKFSFMVEQSKVSEGIDIARTLLNAQITHFYEEQAYTNDVNDLDVEIPASGNFNAPTLTTNEASLVTVERTGGAYKIIAGLNAGATEITCDDSGGTICDRLGVF